MALIDMAVLGMSLVPSDPTVQCTIVVTGVPSTRLKADNLGVYLDGTMLAVTAITVPSAGATIADPGPYNVPLNATAMRTKSDSTLVLREDDESDMINATPQIPGSPSPTPYPVSFTIVIDSAGQTRSKAE